MLTGCPGFRIQPDWDKSIAEDGSKIWFHQYECGVTTYHNIERRGTNFTPDTKDCRCHYHAPNVLQLQSEATGLAVKRTFQSPDAIIHLPYSTERPPRVHLCCMDVGPSGELVLSASSDKSLELWEASTGQVRRTLEGHVGEIYSCRFFPSGLAALTSGADMQLKIWCLLTGRCAATLAPGLAGGVTGTGLESCKEPGGHRAGIMDTGIIHRGRNIVAVDRAGWLRLWDVGTQVCISGIPLVPSTSNHVLKPHAILEEATCLAVKKHPRLPLSIADALEDQSWFHALETSSTNAVEIGTSDALVAVGLGSGGLTQLYELGARSKGCVAQFTLPNATGAVESCSFLQKPQPPSQQQQQQDQDTPLDVSNTSSATSSPPGSPGPPSFTSASTTTAFGEYGLAAGGQNGEVGCWDIRYPKHCLLKLTHEKGAVSQLRLLEAPDQGGHTVNLLVGRSDGRVLLYSLGPSVWLADKPAATALCDEDDGCPRAFCSTLELTGINCEPIRGLSVVPGSSRRDPPGVWTAAHSGVFRHYKTLATRIAFG